MCTTYGLSTEAGTGAGGDGAGGGDKSSLMVFMTSLYLAIFFAGTLGNALVILVILKFPQMRSVTNMYLFNLAISDFLYLWGIPFTVATAFFKGWIFGTVACKLFYILTSLNWFAGVFTITVLSADRYLAVCWATASMKYRNGMVTKIVCGSVWMLSIVVMMPIFIYANTVETRELIDDADYYQYNDMEGNNMTTTTYQPPQYTEYLKYLQYTSQSYDDRSNSSEGNLTGRWQVHVSCTISWTLLNDDDMASEKLFVLYGFLLSFVIPVPMVSVFYILVVVKLARTGRASKGASQVKRSKRKVTVMVMSVITVYVVCWSPYWVMQMIMIFVDRPMALLFNFLTALNYANSALNPLLYAFLSITFRRNFAQLFGCQSLVQPTTTAVTN